MLLLLIGIGMLLVVAFSFLTKPIRTALSIIQVLLGFLALASFFGLFMTGFDSPVALGYTTVFGGVWLLLTVARWKTAVAR